LALKPDTKIGKSDYDFLLIFFKKNTTVTQLGHQPSRHKNLPPDEGTHINNSAEFGINGPGTHV
jgi:hypothetical protein